MWERERDKIYVFIYKHKVYIFEIEIDTKLLGSLPGLQGYHTYLQTSYGKTGEICLHYKITSNKNWAHAETNVEKIFVEA